MKKCSVVGCDQKHYAKGYCKKHYRRFLKYGDPLAGGRWYKHIKASEQVCSVDGCNNLVQARGWCSKHYKRWELYGDPLADFTRVRGECSVEGCTELVHAKGYCKVHYDRWKRNGDPEKLVDMPKGAIEGTSYKRISVKRVDDLAHILFEKVVVNPEFHCWEWQGSFSGGNGGKGRPTLQLRGKNISASRLSYATFVGVVPKGKLVCHICDGGGFCINPFHLYLGTYKNNLDDVEVSKYLQEKGSLSEKGIRGIKLSFLKNIPNEEIAECFGVPVKLLEQIRKKLSWATESFPVDKRLSKGRVLLDKDVVKIKTFLRKGVSGSELARQFGVSRQLVAKIKQGAAWSHIEI